MLLTLHVGLPKTATTSFQRNTLSKYGNYFGPDAANGNETIGLELLRRLQLYGKRSSTYLRSEIVPLFEIMYEKSVECGAQNLIISNEQLTFSPSWYLASDGIYKTVNSIPYLHAMFVDNGFGLSRILEELVVPAWGQYGEVKVSVSLRNQADWVASAYAQGSNNIIRASQADFERQIQRVLEDFPQCLNLWKLVNDLERVVGEDCMHVGIFELFGREEYWPEVRSFFCLPDDEASPYSAPRENERKTKNSWLLRTKISKKNMMNRLRAHCERQGYSSVKTNAFLLANYFAVKAGVLNFGREQQIARTPTFDNIIFENVAASNKLLEQKLNLDLKGLGYFRVQIIVGMICEAKITLSSPYEK